MVVHPIFFWGGGGSDPLHPQWLRPCQMADERENALARCLTAGGLVITKEHNVTNHGIISVANR